MNQTTKQIITGVEDVDNIIRSRMKELEQRESFTENSQTWVLVHQRMEIKTYVREDLESKTEIYPVEWEDYIKENTREMFVSAKYHFGRIWTNIKNKMSYCGHEHLTSIQFGKEQEAQKTSTFICNCCEMKFEPWETEKTRERFWKHVYIRRIIDI